MSDGRPSLPEYHLRPDRGWINDPNGMVFHQGEWHVFYQHNPAGPFHSAIAWGHASSHDLITWRAHPVAFGPTPGGPDSFGCWSGVAVTGLDRPAVVYSGVVDESCQSTILLRWGSADLDTWGEPIVVGRMPTDAGLAIMRDPFVFRWRGHRWGLVGAGASDGTPRVLVYGCDDILHWQYAGIFLDGSADVVARGAAANIYECPQLVPPVGDEPGVLVLSLWTDGVLGDVVGVTGTMEDVDGHPAFRPVHVERIDVGDSFYAPQVADDPRSGAPLMLGWVRQGNLDPETHDVAGCLSLPRRVSVVEGRVSVLLDDALAGLPLGVAREAGPGVHALPSAAVVTVGAGQADLTSAGGVVATLAPGARAFLDAGVAEVFAPGVQPATFRREPGDWALTVGEDAAVEIRTVTAAEQPSAAR